MKRKRTIDSPDGASHASSSSTPSRRRVTRSDARDQAIMFRHYFKDPVNMNALLKPPQATLAADQVATDDTDECDVSEPEYQGLDPSGSLIDTNRVFLALNHLHLNLRDQAKVVYHDKEFLSIEKEKGVFKSLALELRRTQPMLRGVTGHSLRYMYQNLVQKRRELQLFVWPTGKEETPWIRTKISDMALDLTLLNDEIRDSEALLEKLKKAEHILGGTDPEPVETRVSDAAADATTVAKSRRNKQPEPTQPEATVAVEVAVEGPTVGVDQPTETLQPPVPPIVTPVAARSSRSPATTTRSSNAPSTTTARSPKAPSTTTTRSSKAPPTTTTRSSDAPSTTTTRSSDVPSTTTTRSSDAPSTTTTRSSNAPSTTTTRSSNASPATTTRSSNAPPATTTRSSNAPPVTTTRSSKAPSTTTTRSSKTPSANTVVTSKPPSPKEVSNVTQPAAPSSEARLAQADKPEALGDISTSVKTMERTLLGVASNVSSIQAAIGGRTATRKEAALEERVKALEETVKDMKRSMEVVLTSLSAQTQQVERTQKLAEVFTETQRSILKQLS
ncbi:hypothetical protein BGX31_007001 [Mortierella sp. GBA43]|nr:hypothetical protein BGX31_007001 [Mortierella sp. GBA43]